MRNPARQRLAAFVIALWACSYFVLQAHPQKRETTPLRTITGHVLNRQEQPVAKAVVYLKNTKTLAIKTSFSETDGSYHFPALAPNVDYEIYAESQGVRSDTKTLSAFDDRKLVNINLHIK